MLLRTTSPANPVGISANTTRGLKSTDSYVAFSVGVKAPQSDSYVTRCADESMPSLTIVNGILSFFSDHVDSPSEPWPQTNDYIGIGDLVESDLGTFYIKHRIGLNKWFVTNADGSIPSIDTTGTLISIDKVFESLSEAVSGVESLFGTKDLVDSQISVVIACYAMTDSGSIDVAGWTSDEFYKLYIIAPFDVKTQCNKSQRHGGTAGTGYLLKADTNSIPAINTDSEYVSLDGLEIEQNSGISVAELINLNASHCSVTNCLLHNSDANAITIRSSIDHCVCVSNIIYDCDYGIYDSSYDNNRIFNNTIIATTTAIHFDGVPTDVVVTNCILEASTCISHDTADWHNIITSDATVGDGSTCIPNTTQIFKDRSANDFRTWACDIGYDLGADMSSDEYYSLEYDILGNRIDNTWSIGACHYVRKLVLAVAPDVDHQTLPGAGSLYASSVDGIMVFTDSLLNPVPQTDAVFCSGFKVTIGADSAYLFDKIDSSTWRVTDASGNRSPNLSGAVVSIKAPFTDINSAAAFLGTDLVSIDTAVDIAFADGVETLGTTIIATCDSTRRIKIYTPNDIDVDCNSSRRHSGVRDSSLPEMDTGWFLGILALCDSIIIDGLQMKSNGTCISIFSSGSQISNCIISEASYGIGVSTSSSAQSVIKNNIIYDCSDSGIFIYSTYRQRVLVYNNTILNCNHGINILTDDILATAPLITLKNNVCFDCSELDYKMTYGFSKNVEAYCCWSSDLSLNKFNGSYNKTARSMVFRDAKSDDYRISLRDSMLPGEAFDLSVDELFAFNDDIQGETRLAGDWDVGCDNYNAYDEQYAIFSVGSYGSELVSGSISITNGILVFDDTPVDNIGVGDKIIYGAGTTCYLGERGDQQTWKAIQDNGQLAADGSGAIISAVRAYDTISNALSGAAAVLGTQDLSSLGIGLKIKCYDDGDEDTTAVSISGWTTDSINRIIIESPYSDVDTLNKQRHSNYWSPTSPSGFRMSVSGSDAITVNQDHCTIDGLMIATDSYDGIVITGARDDCIVRYNLIKDCDIGINVDTAASTNCKIDFNTIYDFISYGISAALTGLGNHCYNNTVVANPTPASVTAYNFGATSIDVKNCIAQVGLGEVCFSGGVLYNCISSDSTAGSADGNKSLITLIFRDRGEKDFHITRPDVFAIRLGYDTGEYEMDIDSELFDAPFCIGSDYLDVEHVELFFSIGTNTSDISSGTSTTVSISSGVATFSQEQSGAMVGVGDVVTYDTDKVCYLSEKIDYYRWRVITKYGETPDDIGEVDLDSIKKWSNNLITAQADLRVSLGNASSPLSDLVAPKYSINFVVYDGEYYGMLNIVPMTCDADNRIKFYTPFNIYTECNSNRRHRGVYDSNYAGLTGAPSCRLACDYAVVEGLMVFPDAATPGIYTDSAINGGEINGCIIKGCSIGINNVSAIITIKNCIIHDCTSYGISIRDISSSINNTVVGTAGILNVHYSYVRNTIVQDSSGTCFSVPPPGSCISDDSSAGSSNGNLSNTDINFADKLGRNFALAITDTSCRGTASKSTSDEFVFDAIGSVRGRLWDRGAIEYVPVKKIIFSVGSQATNKMTRTKASLIFSTNTDSIATFSEPQVSELLMVGDMVVTIGHGSYYLKKKISSTEWEIQTVSGLQTPSIPLYEVSGIYNAYRYISLAIQGASIVVASDLVAAEASVSIAICKNIENTPIDSLISSKTCDMDCFIKVFAPRDTYSECNSSQRHNGSWETRATIQPYGLYISDCDYIEIEGLQIESGRSGIFIDQSKSPLVLDNIIRNCVLNGIHIDDKDASVGIVVNNLIYGCVNGIDVGSKSASVDSSIHVYNNTIVNCKRGIKHNKYFSTSHGSFIYSYNNLVQDSRYKDFVIDEKFQNYNNSYNCLSSDESLNWQRGSHVRVDQYIQFFSRDDFRYQLRKFIDTTAIDNASDINDNSIFPFDYDIAYRDRDVEYWDVGAFEVADIVGIGDLIIGPLRVYNVFGINTDELPNATLYLYTDKNLTEYPDVTFESIEGSGSLNEFLETNFLNYNLTIYVEPGRAFDGKFNFKNMPDRTVFIQTDPAPTDASVIERMGMPARIEYTDNLIYDESSQESIEFRDMKIYNDVNQTFEYLLSNSSATTNIKFVNCIVQMSMESMVDELDCNIEILNCQLVYRPSGSSTVSISNVTDGTRSIKNTSILVGDESTTTFKNNSTVSPSDTDWVRNCLFYNLELDPGLCGWGDLLTRIVQSKIEDPDLTDVTSLVDIYTVMSDIDGEGDDKGSFKPELTSPLVDSGNNLYVSGIETDISGEPRIFNEFAVDVGPYELRVYKLQFTSENIVSLYQEKLILDDSVEGDEKYLPTYGSVIFNDLYDQFLGDVDKPVEFAREAKIVIKVRMPEIDYITKSDKYNIEIKRLEAYLDEESMSIVCYKSSDIIGDVFGSLFDDDKYVFYFDEVNHILIIYLNQTYDKCLSGSSNVVRNVKFGGPAILSK